jgi:hypothetical protein
MKTWGELRYSSAHSYPQHELIAVAALLHGKEPLIGDSRGSTAGLLLVNIHCTTWIEPFYLLFVKSSVNGVPYTSNTCIFPSVLIIITNMFKV